MPYSFERCAVPALALWLAACASAPSSPPPSGTAEIWRFEREAIGRAVRLQAEDRWDEAEAELEVALATLPGSRVLAAARRQAEARRAARRAALEAELAVHEAVRWLAARDAAERLLAVRGGWFAGLERRRRAAAERRRARALQKHAVAARARGDLDLAWRCLELAQRLHPDPAAAALQAELAAAGRHPPRRAAPPPADPVAALRGALAAADRPALHRALMRLPPGVEPGLVERARAELAAATEAALEAGRRLYAEGRIEAALAVWLEASAWAPDDPRLQAAIERARTVLRNLERLSRRPAVQLGRVPP
ncbi:MAG: hypothetical protein KatS3mg121_1101 [Gammaproteobacteria bacterium]|nr:MAG: hypothetical protein KatS3mg121_1101 [Gammaproteobacteria bacterium]